MNALVVAPLLLVVAGMVASWFLPRVISPAASVRVLTAAALVAAGGVIAGLALVVASGVPALHAVLSWLGWCDALHPSELGTAPWGSALAAGLLALAGLRGLRYHRRHRAEHQAFGHLEGVEVVPAAGPVAFAVPGEPGAVVLGDELVHALDRDERRVVIAHEHAHLDLGHHRYVRAAETCASAFPFLVPLARQVRYNTERWADETAAAAVGSRALVARTIARVALLAVPAPGPGVLGFGGLGASARVDALLNPREPSRTQLPVAASTATILTTLAGASVQVHHLATFVIHCCR